MHRCRLLLRATWILASMLVSLLATPASGVAQDRTPVADQRTAERVLLVQGTIARSGDTWLGAITSIEPVSVPQDLAAGDGEWAIALRDYDDAELIRYPFKPQWTVDQNGEAALVFAFRIPAVPAMTCVHLESPVGELDWKPYS